MKTSTISAIALFLAVTVHAATPTFYTSSATFTAAVGTQVVDGYDSPPYGAGFNLYNNATMSAFLGETDYTSTGFTNGNIVYSNTYCAGCNGSFRLDFTSTSVTSGGAVFGVGLNVLGNSAALPYVAFITYGDTSTQDVAIPSGASFFGVVAPEGIVSIHFGLAGGAATASGAFAIDNLRIAAAGQTGTLILEKQTDPNDPNTVFTFDTSALDPDDPNTPLSDDQTATFPDLAAGSYRVDEMLPSGWTLENVSCTVDTGVNDTVWDANDPNDATGADIVVNGGQTVTCTFTNQQLEIGLSITKTESPGLVEQGGWITYTIVASNAGPDDAFGATVTDDLSDAFAEVNWTCSGSGGGTCTASGTGDISDTVDLPAGASVTYTAMARLEPDFIGTVDNMATISAPGFGGTAAGAAATANQVFAPIPTLDQWALIMLGLLLAAVAIVRQS